MGHAGSQLRDEGATLTSAQFMSVAAKDGECTLGSIVPVDNSGSLDLEGTIVIQYLNADGSTDDDNNYVWDGTQWLKDGDSDLPATETPVAAGQGIWVDNQAGGSVVLHIAAPEL